MSGHDERRAFRAGRVRLALVTSAGSKALGLVVQFLAFPLAVRSLGPERFGIYTMLASALVWIDLGRLGIGPGLTRELAIAWNRDDRAREQSLFSSAIFLLLGFALTIATLLVAGYYVGATHLGSIFGPSATRFRSEILAGIGTAGTFLVLQVVFSIAEAARSAYQDDFVNNLANTLANFVSLLLMVGVALLWPTVPGFAMAVFGAMVLGKGINLALLLHARPYLRPRWSQVDRAELRPLLGSSAAFWVVQIGVLMMHSLSLVQLGHLVGAKELTPFAVVFRLLQLASTGVLMISMPLWPAITDAAVRGDREWIARASRRLILSALAFSTLVAVGFATVGPVAVPLWAGKAVRPDPILYVVLGGYFIVWMWNHCHSTVLFGLGRLWTVGWTVLAEATLVLALAAMLVPRWGTLGTAVGLCVAALATTAWILPLAVRRSLAKPVLPRADLSPATPVGAAEFEEPIT